MRSHEALHHLSQAMSLVVGSTYVLTLQDADKAPRAIVVSFAQQVAFEPPRLVISLHKEREIVAALERQRRVVLNICAADEANADLVDRLAGAVSDPGQLLPGLGAREVGGGYVLDACAGYLVCDVAQRVDIGDHWLYIVEAVEGLAVPGRVPMIHERRSGLRY